jgi:AcrR family transcriptional regulator
MDGDMRTYSYDEALVKLRRMQIIQGAAKVFVKKGYDSTNMRELAAACNMSIGALYHYIGSKEDILYLFINDGLSRLAELVEGFFNRLGNVTPTEALREFIKVYYQEIGSNDSFCLFTYQETKNLGLDARRHILESASRDVAACEKLLRWGIEAGEFEIDNPTVVAHNIIVLGHMWAVRRWFLRDYFTLEDYITEQTELILGQCVCTKTYPA